MDSIASKILSSKGRFRIEGAIGSSKYLFVQRLFEAISYDVPILYITSKREIEQAVSDIGFFVSKMSGKSLDSVILYPPWEVLPFELLSPHPDISGERLNVLHRISRKEPVIVICPIEALIQRVMPEKVLKKNFLTIEIGDELERDLLTDFLVSAGYQFSDMVECKGEFSIRGAIVDIFTSSSSNPVRIEFFGDEVEGLKEFDKNSQRSIKFIKKVDILPARELVLDSERAARGVSLIKDFKKNKNIYNEEITDCFSQSIAFTGMERFLPFFYEHSTILDYLPKNATVVVDEADLFSHNYDSFFETVTDEYKRSLERGDLCPEPEMLYINLSDLKKELDSFRIIELSSLKASEGADIFQIDVNSITMTEHSFVHFEEKTANWLQEGNKIFTVLHSDGQAERMKELLTEKEIGAKILPKGETINLLSGSSKLEEVKENIVTLIISSLSSGFYMPSMKVVFVTEDEIYGAKKRHRVRTGGKREKLLQEIDHLIPNTHVVHIDYGVGLYHGTKFISIHNREEELIHIEYADGERLYLPMHGITRLQKYRGVEDTEPLLAKLGTSSWKKATEKAKEDAKKIAKDLLNLYAAREVSSGIKYSSNTTWHDEFNNSFEYNETEDQRRTIEEVLSDMESYKPMDRLVCGDVGFGKTEVAMRAAFKAVYDKKQTAMLVPTTILAHQHYQTFKQRFASFPINIEMLSRFKTPKEQREIIAGIKAGTVDIVIGTHRLIQKDIEFNDLGLLIIDEEHRFGVKHKEKIKKLRHSVDILTLTATPIPRTLHISLSGIRDMSIINTPPHDRQAVKTYIRKFDDRVIHDAIVRELERDGQVYFLHNRVDTINSMASYLEKLVPHADIAVAHGQMKERELEKVMLDFVNRKKNILLCTTIIESGLDIPSANTIIINRADKFGLAQLYQLRGRVGRDRHRAYAYLLVPENVIASKPARARLEAIEELSDLGAGLQIATKDLEIRGSGNILGHKQSGNISSVGYYMFIKLLEDSIKDIKGEKVADEVETVVNVGIKGYIPKTYIPDVNQRLEMYKRLYIAESNAEIGELKDELEDRYGAAPPAVADLLSVLSLRLEAKSLKISRIEKVRAGIIFTFEESTPCSAEKLLEMVKRYKGITFLSPNLIQVKANEEAYKNNMAVWVKKIINAFRKTV